MLTPNQERYLQTIPENKKVIFRPYDSRIKKIARDIIGQIKSPFPDVEVIWIGASALGISGQGDIDLHILSTPKEYAQYLPTLKQLFGIPAKETPTLVQWELDRNGYTVELYLTDRDSEGLIEQMRIFEVLRDNPSLLEEYKRIKEEASRGSFRDYMRAKYEFYNQVLAQP